MHVEQPKQVCILLLVFFHYLYHLSSSGTLWKFPSSKLTCTLILPVSIFQVNKYTEIANIPLLFVQILLEKRLLQYPLSYILGFTFFHLCLLLFFPSHKCRNCERNILWGNLYTFHWFLHFVQGYFSPMAHHRYKEKLFDEE